MSRKGRADRTGIPADQATRTSRTEPAATQALREGRTEPAATRALREGRTERAAAQALREGRTERETLAKLTGRGTRLARATACAAATTAVLLAACVGPSGQPGIRELLERVQSPRPGSSPGIASSVPPGAGNLAESPRPTGPAAVTPGPGAPTPQEASGRLWLEAELDAGTPAFAVLGLPPGFAAARYQLAAPGGQTSRVGMLEVATASARGSAVVSDLPPGTYAILVVMLDAAGLVMASGTASIDVPEGGEATASVRVGSPGQQEVRIDLPGVDMPTPSFTLGGLAAGSVVAAGGADVGAEAFAGKPGRKEPFCGPSVAGPGGIGRIAAGVLGHKIAGEPDPDSDGVA